CAGLSPLSLHDALPILQTPGSRALPPRPAQMLPEVTPAMRTAEALRRLTGRSRSSHPPRSGALLSGDPVSLGPDTSRGVILYLEDLTVSFDGFKALNALTLYVATGELRCIICRTGAGKTTMMDVITGKTRPNKGSAWFGQTLDLLTLTEPEIAEAGIGRKFQNPAVFEKHSAFENLELALAGSRSVWRNLVAKLGGEQRDRISEVLRLIGLATEADRPAGVLSHGQKQWLEIGMLLMQNPRLLLVDEPVAGMTPQEVERTAELLV